MQQEVWHREDIAAAIRKSGITLVELSRRGGFSDAAVASALLNPWPSVEGLIAQHLGVPPQILWPARYDAEGSPLVGGWSHPKRRVGAAHRQKQDVG